MEKIFWTNFPSKLSEENLDEFTLFSEKPSSKGQNGPKESSIPHIECWIDHRNFIWRASWCKSRITKEALVPLSGQPYALLGPWNPIDSNVNYYHYNCHLDSSYLWENTTMRVCVAGSTQMTWPPKKEKIKTRKANKRIRSRNWKMKARKS